ncbi:MAG: DUF4136 domain-containing protein [Saprospiraceae bacterium]|nr:DUF4136 domain-containing protein [Saprospiraceae bacterium]MBK8298713.1 DUF4136 domain-containing protein [Saprospiraceae bacterium]
MKIFLSLTSIMLLAACGVYNNISSDYDRSVDFTKYKTFAWLPDKDSTNTPTNNQIIRNNTINYFSHCMGERGMKANVDSPDVLLQLVVYSVKKEYTTTSPAFYNYPSYNYSNPYYYPYPNSYYYRSHNYRNYYNYNSIYSGNYSNTNRSYTTQKVEYTQSIITLNVIDAKQNKLVWLGTAEGDLYDPSYIEYNLHPAVYDILTNYPVNTIREHKKPKS